MRPLCFYWLAMIQALGPGPIPTQYLSIIIAGAIKGRGYTLAISSLCYYRSITLN